MTRYVLLVGVLVAALLTLVWTVFTVLPSLPDTGIAGLDSILHNLRLFAAINGYNDPTPFTRTGRLFQFWFVCLLVAFATDRFVKPAAETAVSAFAARLSPLPEQSACKVSQESTWRAEIRTTTRGTFSGRQTSVLVYQRPNRSYLTVEMDCRTPWMLDIRKRNLSSEALAFCGAPIKTGDDALDETAVIQGDDESAIQQWVRSAQVRMRILSLLQVVKITSLTTQTAREGEAVLRAYYAPFRPRLFPSEHAARILSDLAALAESAEAVRIRG